MYFNFLHTITHGNLLKTSFSEYMHTSADIMLLTHIDYHVCFTFSNLYVILNTFLVSEIISKLLLFLPYIYNKKVGSCIH